MTTDTKPSPISVFLDAIDSIKSIDRAGLEQALSAAPVEQQTKIIAMINGEEESDEIEEEEGGIGQVELSVEGFYHGTPKPAELAMISKHTGYPADPDDWEVVSIRASDNLSWMSYPAVWHENILRGMTKQFPGKTLLLDHNSYQVANSRGFFIKTALIQDEDAPPEIINNLGRGKINRSIVKAGGWKQVIVMAAIHRDEEALLSRVKARSVQDVSTGSFLSGVRQICPHCSEKMGREVEASEKDEDGRYTCPHEVPTPFMMMLVEWGYFDEEIKFMEYVIIDGEGQVHNETSFVVEGNLASAGVLRS
jgi:hypothetical protein